MPRKNFEVSFSDKKRLVLVALFTFLVFCFLIVQFYKLQIIEGEKWVAHAKAQHQYVVKEPFRRGRFFLNPLPKVAHPEKAQAIVMDIPKFHLFIDPEAISGSNRALVATSIFKLLRFTEENSKKALKEFYRKSHSRKIASWLDPEDKDRVLLWWSKFAKEKKIAKNALFFILDYKRSYPYGTMLGQLIHTVRDEKEPQNAQHLPTGGLETYFDKFLKGEEGRRVIIRSPRHGLDIGEIVKKPKHGADVYLTINRYIQAIMEEELEKGVKNAQAKGGWAIMMDPENGEILGIAQYPFFDLKRYSEYFNSPQLKDETRLRAVTDAYEPGSVFKPLTMSVCLKANEEQVKLGRPPIFSPSEKVATSDGRVQGRSKPFKDGRLHHFLNIYMGIQKSSNVYMVRIVDRVVRKMGSEWFKNAYIDLFGLSKKTCIESPGETAGHLPTLGKLHPNGKLEWSADTPYCIAIGHNILVTSMQLIKSYATIANGGFEVFPHFIRKIVRKDKGARVVLLNNKKLGKKKRRVLSENSIDILKRAMKYTTKFGGTAFLGDIAGYSEAGKTGTSEKIIGGKYSSTYYISSFIGFAPVKKPRFVLEVVIDEPKVCYIPGKGKNHNGGTCAAPIFREIGRRTLEYLGVAPDDPFGYPVADPRRDAAKADWQKEVKELKELYQKWNGG